MARFIPYRQEKGHEYTGLQVFVNVPQELRYEDPSSLLIRRQDMPVLANDRHRVHVVLGDSNGVAGAKSPGLPMTILDGQLANNGSFEHELTGGRNAWVHAIDGEIEVAVLANCTRLRTSQAIAINNSENGQPITVHVSADNHSEAQFALLDGQAVNATYVQIGPFVTGSMDEIESIKRAFDEGRFGSLD